IDPDTLGRIAAQSAKQIMIQKIREAERDTLYDEFIGEKGTIVNGVAQRQDGGVVTVSLNGKTESILPRSEQMPGESFRPGERVRAVLLDVRKSGQRVKLVLSRNHPDFVRRLFEQEIPEIAERIIEIRAIAREAGFRSKVAVTSIDSKVDCVGACVGVRGSRIKNVVEELNGERIDIIRFNDSMQIMIPYALAPAQIEEVQIYTRIGRAIVLVREDQLSLAIGKRGQNVRLASKLVGIDIEIMTFDELAEEIEKAEFNYTQLPSMTEEMIEKLIEEGILSFDDLSVMEPEHVMEMTGCDEDTAVAVIAEAEEAAENAPPEPTTRSNVISTGSQGGASAAMRAAEQLLGPSDPADKVEERLPSLEDVFGRERLEPVMEPRITAADIFGDAPMTMEEPVEADESEEELRVAQLAA
ncbi:MAG: transcription termination factor NusA, partial [Planctomycetia bacterium]